MARSGTSSDPEWPCRMSPKEMAADDHDEASRNVGLIVHVTSDVDVCHEVWQNLVGCPTAASPSLDCQIAKSAIDFFTLSTRRYGWSHDF